MTYVDQSGAEGAVVASLDLQHRRLVLDHDTISGEFSLRRLDPDGDLDLMHSWMNDPEVARFWRKPWPRDRIGSYLRDQDRSTHSVPVLGELDGVPISYWELYRADLDPLAQYYPARAHDVGFHMLLGPARYRGRGLAARLMDAISTWLLDADPSATRVVTEPDITNERVVRMLERAGFYRLAVVDLPDKRAALMVRDREQP
ncbi:hypothetical protein MFM001_14430 [Mycobacterium sp. MFM001]|uniref:GNAT family N-acetyltransferase n=1 Tax=Mycobacterium sp. MFM001 TaxID=2049453 RepID=UPI000DA5AA6B|nr:GNAT family N-acetyltransferase [Mycobacterium sp. MFM001]GBE64981.1 hypothetical protein MFM001_14430 [Mycobacterium sp. MFM001]